MQRLRGATSDSDAWVRYYACQALGHAGDEEAAELLLARAEDAAGQVRVAAVDALARLSTPAAFEALGRATQHADLEVRRAALAGTGATRQRALLPLLLDASYSPETATRLVAASSLANFDDPAALNRLYDVATADPELSVQNAAIELLADKPTPQATAVLVGLLSNEIHRSRATHALSRHVASRTGMHLSFERNADGYRARVGSAPEGHLHRPSLDVTLQSAADVASGRVLGIVLTGMGSDGLEGARAVHKKGGTLLTQSEASCVVYGMPRVIWEDGIATAQASIEDMPALLLRHL